MPRTPNFFRSASRRRSPSRDAHGHRRGVSLSQTQPESLPVPSDMPRRSSSDHLHPFGMRGANRLAQRRTMDETHFLHSQARARNLVVRPTVDLRIIDYVAAVDENLTCPICRCPFIDPVILTDCEHCFCRDCIRQTWVTISPAYDPHGPRGDCPTCRTPGKLGARGTTTKILVNILDDLLVKCPKSSEGCPLELKRGEVQDHVSIYCGYATVDCPADDCTLSIRRKDSARGCLHTDASCLACHEQVQTADLETHWNSTCPDRVFACDLCGASVSYKNMHEHNQSLCPSVSIPCPGAAIGCAVRGRKEEAELHARSCVLATLAPVMQAQRQRMDEQEAAQKEMSRRLQVLEDSFTRIERLAHTPIDDLDANDEDEENLFADFDMTHHHPSAAEISSDTQFPPYTELADAPEYQDRSADRSPRIRPALTSANLDLAVAPPASSRAPYTSPFHHLLSMHEALREEVGRTTAALAELDGRHSMQIINENLRLRDELNFVNGQVANVQRSVSVLVSDRWHRQQLQLAQTQRNTGGTIGESASVGESMERAVSAVGEVVRGAVRIVNVHTGARTENPSGSTGPRLRRGNSDESRPTKL